jgi:hypothetical protein
MRTLAPPVPDRFDDMHPIWWVLYAILCLVLVAFWGAVLLAVL